MIWLLMKLYRVAQDCDVKIKTLRGSWSNGVNLSTNYFI